MTAVVDGCLNGFSIPMDDDVIENILYKIYAIQCAREKLSRVSPLCSSNSKQRQNTMDHTFFDQTHRAIRGRGPTTNNGLSAYLMVLPYVLLEKQIYAAASAADAAAVGFRRPFGLDFRLFGSGFCWVAVRRLSRTYGRAQNSSASICVCVCVHMCVCLSERRSHACTCACVCSSCFRSDYPYKEGRRMLIQFLPLGTVPNDDCLLLLLCDCARP